MNPYLDDDDPQKKLRQGILDNLDQDGRGTTVPVNAKPTPVPVTEADNPDDQIGKWYQQYTGRAPDPEGLAAHRKNPYGMAGIESAIKESPEARAYADRPKDTAAPSTSQPDLSKFPGATSIGEKTSGWGFNSPTGGSRTFEYTPASYGGGFGGFSGYRDMARENFTDQDYGSIKYVFARAAQGLGEGDGGFTEQDLDTAVARLNAQGIPARKVDPYQIDFGLGEGPIQVRGSDNTVRWFRRDEGEGNGASPTGAPMALSGGGALGGDSLTGIQKLIQDLVSQGYSRDALLALLKG